MELVNVGNSHNNTLLLRIHFAVLIDAGHVLVVALLGLDLIWEPFFQKHGEFVIEIVCGRRGLVDVSRE